jgi:hypothetical protein
MVALVNDMGCTLSDRGSSDGVEFVRVGKREWRGFSQGMVDL